jgi:hypothetical protein
MKMHLEEHAAMDANMWTIPIPTERDRTMNKVVGFKVQERAIDEGQ